jgi:hypothetical protein
MPILSSLSRQLIWPFGDGGTFRSIQSESESKHQMRKCYPDFASNTITDYHTYCKVNANGNAHEETHQVQSAQYRSVQAYRGDHLPGSALITSRGHLLATSALNMPHPVGAEVRDYFAKSPTRNSTLPRRHLEDTRELDDLSLTDASEAAAAAAATANNKDDAGQPESKVQNHSHNDDPFSQSEKITFSKEGSVSQCSLSKCASVAYC